jgi:double-stranded uracil-DNA glycosylase
MRPLKRVDSWRSEPHNSQCSVADSAMSDKLLKRGAEAASGAGPLRDRLAPDLRILFVGINPGLRSAATGHHFAGYSNRFWTLLADSGLVPERLTYEDDGRLPGWGLGLTNLIARPSRGVGDLRPDEYGAGWCKLERKVRRYRPAVAALVGVTVYRAILPMLVPAGGRPRPPRAAASAGPVLGLRPESIHGVPIFVLPNPSGRNAHYRYEDMLAAFRALRQFASHQD